MNQLVAEKEGESTKEYAYTDQIYQYYLCVYMCYRKGEREKERDEGGRGKARKERGEAERENLLKGKRNSRNMLSFFGPDFHIC